MTVLAWLPTELRAWGLDVVAVTGWRDRRRPGTFTPAGCLIHHTAGPRGKDAPSLQVCIDGRSGLPGPLCQILIARSGKVYVISAGRANHAGAGGPVDGITDGNGQLLGIELENDGVGEPWPSAQLTAAHRATAAVLKGLGGSGPVWGHKEWAPGRKSDPTFSMAEYRTAVRGLLYPKETPVPTDNPYPTETAEALELLAEHAGYVGDRKWFGPDALAALHRLKNRAEGLAATNVDLAGHNVTLASERDTAVANREAAEAEALQLRRQLQEGGPLPALLADIDAAVLKLAAAAELFDAALAKARA